MVVYCAGCGLYMMNGFCLHGSVDEAQAEAQKQRT